jgi:hypothetical protein
MGPTSTLCLNPGTKCCLAFAVQRHGKPVFSVFHASRARMSDVFSFVCCLSSCAHLTLKRSQLAEQANHQVSFVIPLCCEDPVVFLQFFCQQEVAQFLASLGGQLGALTQPPASTISPVPVAVSAEKPKVVLC